MCGRREQRHWVRRQPEYLSMLLKLKLLACSTFHPFIEDTSVRMIGVEAGGDGVDTPYHSATLAKGTIGVLHGVKTYLLQTASGQITETHSISPGLDYPGVGPEHAWLKDSGRAQYIVATDEDALRGFRMCSETEGIIPGKPYLMKYLCCFSQ